MARWRRRGEHDGLDRTSGRPFLVVAGAALLLTAVAGPLGAGCTTTTASPGEASGTAEKGTGSPQPTSPSTTAQPPGTTVPPTTAPESGSVDLLRPGSTGASVVALQRRLAALGYWLGNPDGTYGPLTEQAVVALQKVAGLPRDGVFGPLTAVALDRDLRPAPRSTSGNVVEIDLEHQVVLLVSGGRLDAVLDTSTGSGASYVQEGRTNVAVTPPGHYRIFRQVDGADVSPLGVLWRPKYFDGGIALHGYPDVPPYPASHGCVRVSDAAIDWIWDNDLAPLGTEVWVY